MRNKYTFKNAVSGVVVTVHALCAANAIEKLLREVQLKTLTEDWKLTKIEVRK